MNSMKLQDKTWVQRLICTSPQQAKDEQERPSVTIALMYLLVSKQDNKASLPVC